MHYHGEKLMDTDTVDTKNEAVMAPIRKTIRDMMEEANECLSKTIVRFRQSIEKADTTLQKTNIEKIEKKKSFFSNILYLIGSIFAPEYTPTSFAGEQRMPKGMRKAYHDNNTELTGLRDKATSQLQIILAFQPELKRIGCDILSSDEKLIHFLRCSLEAYKENDSHGKYYNTVFLFMALQKAGYLDEAGLNHLISGGLSFTDSRFQENLSALNEWYIKYTEQAQETDRPVHRA